MGQIGRARETEGKNGLGTIIRAQQAYHHQNGSFAAFTDPEIATNNVLGINVDSDYYTFAGSSPDLATHINIPVIPINGAQDGVRTFGGGIVYNAGNYGSAICMSDAINGGAGFGPGQVAGAASATTYYCANGTQLR